MSQESRDSFEPLNYLEMLKEAKSLAAVHYDKEIRLALLCDFASQQLVPLLTVLCARRGVRLEVYEAGYDTIDLEILSPDSALYAFKPQYVALLLSSQKLTAKLETASDRASFAADTVSRLENLWSILSQHCQATIIQSTFVIPSERAFGNYELKVEESIGSLFATINYALVQAARKAKNVLLCDVDFLAGEVGRRNWFDERLWSIAKVFCHLNNLPLVAKALTDVILAANGTFIKCVVLDLDNTLWGGVIGDDGVAGIILGDFDEGESFVAFQRFLAELKRRGIILAVVSKNEHDAAILPFREHPNMVLKENDIAVFVANWNNKADNIRLVQKTLNIGFDSMVFLDDNPFERNIVRQYIPEVLVPELPGDEPALYLRTLADLNLFETASFSETDRQRVDQYREAAQRELAKASFSNVEEYLASLQMEIKLERFNSFNLPRIAQLIQRSNQFNLATRRYSEGACEEIMQDANFVPLTLTLSDKYGDYGLISVIILKFVEDGLDFDELLMSCRVLQRGVEHFAMNRIVAFAQKQGLHYLYGTYLRTPKNAMVKNFYATFGFEKVAEEESGNSRWRLPLDSYAPIKTFLTPVEDAL